MASDLPLSISIAMATYNGARFLPDQLNSIASQTLLPYELIITDDGSLDETCSIIREFAKTSPFPVRLFHNHKRLGYRDNFIKAAYQCKGDLIAFCDQDDIWRNDKLEVQQKYFKDPKVAMVTHPYQVMDTDGRVTKTVFPKMKRIERLSPLSFNVFFTYYGMTLMFRRTILPPPECINTRPVDYCAFDKMMSHDQWIPFLATSSYVTIFLPNAFTLYRQHNGNTCGPQLRTTKLSRLKRIISARSPEMFSELCLNLSNSLISMVSALTSGCVSNHQTSPEGVDRAIAFYSDLSENYKKRAELYNSRLSRLKRLSAFLKALFSGAYGPKQKSLFGLSGAFRDFISILIYRTTK